MCGIVGLIQPNTNVVPALMHGLSALEYRGYDSAGIAVVNGNSTLEMVKIQGKTSVLRERLDEEPLRGSLGIAHTRWATHGEPSETNAHPHIDCHGDIALVHNGIIENHASLRQWLEQEGHSFRSQTDTEVVGHLIEQHYRGDLVQAVQEALALIEGAYAVAVVHREQANRMVVARHGSPLVIGICDENGYMVASDESVMVGHASRVLHLQEGTMAELTASGYQTMTIANESIDIEVQDITMVLSSMDKGDHAHFMHAEIHEQPETLAEAMRGRLLLDQGTAKLGGLENCLAQLQSLKRMIIAACGTSWHAALVGEYMLENLAGLQVEVDYASELRYRRLISDVEEAIVVISQSGETADTLEALRKAKKRGLLTLGICNVAGSAIARETDAGVYLRARREIGVASTKAFTSQVMVLGLMTLMIGRLRGEISQRDGQQLAQAMEALPAQVQSVLDNEGQVREIAARFADCQNFLFLGRGYNFPVALEGALKLKEISYIHAEGYPAAEMKHGPIALIDERMPAIVIATDTQDVLYQKVLSNIEEIKSRRGTVIAIVSEGNSGIRDVVDEVIYVPQTLDLLSPMVNVVPLQLLAYHVAVLRGCDVDQPRNLAKSVTVE